MADNRHDSLREELRELLRAAEETQDGDRIPGDEDIAACVFVDVHPDRFDRVIRLAIGALAEAPADAWEAAFALRALVAAGLVEQSKVDEALEVARQARPQSASEIVQASLNECMGQREEILRAFVAKYGFGPEEAVQIVGSDWSWRVIRRADMAATTGQEADRLRWALSEYPKRNTHQLQASKVCAGVLALAEQPQGRQS